MIACTAEVYADDDVSIKYTEELSDVVGTVDDNSYISIAVYLNVNETEYNLQKGKIGASNEKFVPFYDFVSNAANQDLLDNFFEWGRECLKIDPSDVPVVSFNDRFGTQYFYNYYDYESYYDRFIDAHDLFSCFPEFEEYTDAPCLYLKATKEKLKEIASDESVVCIDFKDADPTVLDAGVYRYFDSSDALRILRESVSSTKKHFGPNYDVNNNGIVESDDALTALRVSVGFVEQATFFDKWETFKLYDRTQYKESDINIVRP